MAPKRLLWVHSGPPAEQTVPGTCWHKLCLPPGPALDQLQTTDFDAIVLAFPLPPGDPLTLVRQIRNRAAGTPILIADSSATLSDAVRYGRSGVAGMLNGSLEESLLRTLAEIRRADAEPPPGPRNWRALLVGESPEIHQVCEIIRMVGSRRATVLITGETGTGKEIAARALHLAGPRYRAPLVAVNCSALPENLLEAELFGHVRGAFTGAVQTRIGRFEQAQGGSLFLDEIGELPRDLQVKLLRVLQEREVQRLGSSESIRVDMRVIAATNCDLGQRIEQAKFREDLYYRLNVVPLVMPPLRERVADIPLLAAHFVDKICRAEGIPLKRLEPGALIRLGSYSWPGNVRQLENAIEMAIALSGDREELAAADFPVARPVVSMGDLPSVAVPDAGLDYEKTLAWIERSILQQALHKTGGNKKAAAEMLRLKRTTLSAKVRSLDASAA